MVVVPPWTVPFKHFSGTAIAMALALWGLCGASAAEVRQRVNERQSDGACGWERLAKWACEAATGRFFAKLGLGPLTGQPHALSARVAQALCGWASAAAGSSYEQQAFAGACHVS
jgi:hypothetical protein